jgi:hypothetical protein
MWIYRLSYRSQFYSDCHHYDDGEGVWNWVLRGVFGVKRDGVTGEWRKLHNEELNGLYCSPVYCAGDKIEKNEIGRACSVYGGGERGAQGVGGET